MHGTRSIATVVMQARLSALLLLLVSLSHRYSLYTTKFSRLSGPVVIYNTIWLPLLISIPSHRVYPPTHLSTYLLQYYGAA